MRNCLAIVLLLIFSPLYAFQADYIWQDKFRAEIKGARAGNMNAQYEIAEMYDRGFGTYQDYNKAFMWYKKSATQGHVKAKTRLGFLYMYGLGTKKNTNQAYKLLKKPAENGNVRAQYYLGIMYKDGIAVKKNPEEALTWLTRSSLGGYPPADDMLSKLKTKMSGSNYQAKIATFNTSASKRKSSVKVNNVINDLLSGNWLINKRPSDILPSKINNCKKTSQAVIECISNERQRDTGRAKIKYVTKAVLFDLKHTGAFNVAYRNKVIKIRSKNKFPGNDIFDFEEEASEVYNQVKLGWQNTEHRLVCKIKRNDINCTKNKTKKLKFTRKKAS